MLMVPDRYELIKYEVHNIETWVVKDTDGNVWYPLKEIFTHLFHINMNVTQLRKTQLKHTIRLRMTTPRKQLKQLTPEQQPKDVIIFGDLWCVKNIIRTRIKLNQDAEYKGRDILVEDFAQYWGFNVIGFGVLTHKEPKWYSYPFIDQIAIAAEANKKTWLKCVECEHYYPYTQNFFRINNVTCEKCLGREFKIRSTGAYGRIEELLKKRKRD